MTITSAIGSGLDIYGRFQATSGAILVSVMCVIGVVAIGWRLYQTMRDNIPIEDVRVVTNVIDIPATHDRAATWSTRVSYSVRASDKPSARVKCRVAVPLAEGVPGAKEGSVLPSNGMFVDRAPRAGHPTECASRVDNTRGRDRTWLPVLLVVLVLVTAVSVGSAWMTWRNRSYAQVVGGVSLVGNVASIARRI